MGPVPSAAHGWLVALGLYAFIAFAMGPGVVVWLALSELMPTRIRSNGMSIALVLNQMVSTTLAAIFLPFVSKRLLVDVLSLRRFYGSVLPRCGAISAGDEGQDAGGD